MSCFSIGFPCQMISASMAWATSMERIVHHGMPLSAAERFAITQDYPGHRLGFALGALHLELNGASAAEPMA